MGFTGWKANFFKVGRKQGIEAVAALARSKSPAPSEIYRLCHGLKLEILLHMMALAPSEVVRQAVSRYIATYRFVRPRINGNDLKAMGYPPGPLYKKILDDVLGAVLDGRAQDRDAELSLVKKMFPLERYGA